MSDFGNPVARLAARALAGIFRLWQLSFSVILPPSCRFTPSCSHYGIEALKRHGLVAGLWLTVRRISRCHPWGGQGFDPVPETFYFFPRAAARPHRAPSRQTQDKP